MKNTGTGMGCLRNGYWIWLPKGNSTWTRSQELGRDRMRTDWKRWNSREMFGKHGAEESVPIQAHFSPKPDMGPKIPGS